MNNKSINTENEIYKIRRRTGLSQNEFAKKYHLTPRSIQSWEQDFRKPSDGVLYMLDRLVAIDFEKGDTDVGRNKTEDNSIEDN